MSTIHTVTVEMNLRGKEEGERKKGPNYELSASFPI